MGLKAAVQALKKAEPLKDKVQHCKDLLNDNDAWICQQQLQKIYQQVLILDLEYALDRKVEQELWNLGFKNYIATLQTQAKDRKNPKRGESQAMLGWCLEAASGFYLTLLQEICTAFDLDLPFRRKNYIYGCSTPWKAVEKLSAPHKSSCFYACQYCLVHLGDIARYRNQNIQAELFYRHAVSLSPSSGQPYNQLALLEASRGDKLGTVFHYARSVAVKHPFPVATSNLAKTLSSALNDNSFSIEGKTKLSSQEYITVFLKLHGILHNLGDLTATASHVKLLTETLTALVATESFSSRRLVQMLVINLYALHHTAGQSIDSTELLRSEQLSSDENIARDCILDLIAGSLSALLLPVYTIKNAIVDYFALPTIKLCLDWMRLQPTVLEEPAFVSRLQIWPSLCVLLNGLQSCVVDFDNDQYSKVPLPEDRDLQGFLPLEKSFESLRFANTDLEGNVAGLNKLRAVRILSVGNYLAQYQIAGTSFISVVIGERNERKFACMTEGSGPSNELMKELEELSLNKERQPAIANSPVPSESASSKASSETDIPDHSLEKRVGILKPQGSLERNRDSNAAATIDATNMDLNSMSSTRKPRQNVAMQAIMRRAETEQKQVTFKNVSPMIIEELDSTRNQEPAPESPPVPPSSVTAKKIDENHGVAAANQNGAPPSQSCPGNGQRGVPPTSSAPNPAETHLKEWRAQPDRSQFPPMRLELDFLNTSIPKNASKSIQNQPPVSVPGDHSQFVSMKPKLDSPQTAMLNAPEYSETQFKEWPAQTDLNQFVPMRPELDFPHTSISNVPKSVQNRPPVSVPVDLSQFVPMKPKLDSLQTAMLNAPEYAETQFKEWAAQGDLSKFVPMRMSLDYPHVPMPNAPKPVQNRPPVSVPVDLNQFVPMKPKLDLPQTAPAHQYMTAVDQKTPPRSQFGLQAQGLVPSCPYPNQTFNVQNPQFSKNFVTSHVANVPSQYQMPGGQYNGNTPNLQQCAGIQQLVHQTQTADYQRLGQASMMQQSGLSGPSQAGLGTGVSQTPDIQQQQQPQQQPTHQQQQQQQQQQTLQNITSGLPQNMGMHQQQQDNGIGILRQNVMPNNMRSSQMNIQNQMNIPGPSMVNNGSGMPVMTGYQKNIQQGPPQGLQNIQNPPMSPTGMSSLQSNFNPNFGQNIYNRINQKQISPPSYGGKNTNQFVFPNQATVMNKPQHAVNNYPMFHNYEATDFNLWKDTQPPQPPVAWWGGSSTGAPQIPTKDTTSSATEAFQNWANSPGAGGGGNGSSMINRAPLTPGNNYHQNPLHGKHYNARNSFDEARQFEMKQKQVQPTNTGNTYSLFSGNTWGSGGQTSNISSNQDQPKTRLSQQSLWSGPGPSPLERLLEQQKSLREGGT